MSTLASDFNLFAAGSLAEVTAILLAGRNHALARLVRALTTFCFCHVDGFSLVEFGAKWRILASCLAPFRNAAENIRNRSPGPVNSVSKFSSEGRPGGNGLRSTKLKTLSPDRVSRETGIGLCLEVPPRLTNTHGSSAARLPYLR